MRRRDSVRATREIMQVRLIQRSAAEFQVVKAEAKLRRLEELRRENVDKMQNELQCWSEALSGPSLGLHIARAWSATILHGEMELDRLDLQIREAQDERTARNGAWRAARARADAAKIMVDQVDRQEKRLLEEAELGDVADRFMQRRVSR